MSIQSKGNEMVYGSACNDDKLKNRRGMARLSFFAILLTLFILIGAIFFGGPNVAQNANSLAPIIGTLLACLTTVVLDYSHSARKKHHASDSEDSRKT